MATATLKTTDAGLTDALKVSIRQLGESMREAAERCSRAGRMGDRTRAEQYADSYFRMRARNDELCERAEEMGIDVDA